LIEGTGGNYDFPAFTFSKQLTVIGSGFNSDADGFQLTTLITYSSYPFTMDNGANGSRFYGIKFFWGVVLSPATSLSTNVDNIVFEDCRFGGFGMNTGTGIHFKNCIFGASYTYATGGIGINAGVAGPGTPGTSVIFDNCVFDAFIDGHSSTIGSITINHCLFLIFGSTWPSSPLIDLKMYASTILNSIFLNCTSVVAGTTSGCSFYNNIWRAAPDYPSGPPGSSSGTGNIKDDYLTLENFPNDALCFTDPWVFDTLNDFALSSRSPASYSTGATDGTAIGVHGGISKFSESGEPLITPIMQGLSITTTTIAPSGTLKVHIHARKPHED